jgi:hypothetical protein
MRKAEVNEARRVQRVARLSKLARLQYQREALDDVLAGRGQLGARQLEGLTRVGR